MNEPLMIERDVHFHRRGLGAVKELRAGAAPPCPASGGRVPRVARLMALALRFERLLREGIVQDGAELARLGHETRTRISQILSLLHLAPDIQEALLFLPPTERGRDALHLAQLMPIACCEDWARQRRRRRRLLEA